MSQPEDAPASPLPPPQAGGEGTSGSPATQTLDGGGRFANAVAKRILHHMRVIPALERERDKLAKRCKRMEAFLDIKGYDMSDVKEVQQCTYCDVMFIHDSYAGWCCFEKDATHAHKFWCKSPHGDCEGSDMGWCEQCKGPTCLSCLEICTVCPISPHCADCIDCTANSDDE
jgi:hypothetical protein